MSLEVIFSKNQADSGKLPKKGFDLIKTKHNVIFTFQCSSETMYFKITIPFKPSSFKLLFLKMKLFSHYFITHSLRLLDSAKQTF